MANGRGDRLSRRLEFLFYNDAGRDGVMRGEIPARAQGPAYLSNITFYEIESGRFKWKYEFSSPGEDQAWMEASRLERERES